MSKNKLTFYCKECGYETSGWMGKCPGCNSWNTLVEAPTNSKNNKSDKTAIYDSSNYKWVENSTIMPLNEASSTTYDKTSTGISEIDELLGGGITNGSVILVGGEPGIGKSTLLLQLANSYNQDNNILYVSGEESPSQIAMRAKRLQIDNQNITLCTETNFEIILETIQKYKPSLCIIDSIQTLYSENSSGTPGSISQAREVTAGLIRIAKSNHISFILIGHVTKDGNIAGPKTLEHMVDTVLYFEGESMGNYRILRSIKNRFGRSNELCFFEMCENGLVSVESASELLLRARPLNSPGSVLTTIIEGSKAIVLEVQALVGEATYGTPQRMTSGIDKNRATMLLAIIEKILQLPVNTKDTFINVIGGMKINDLASDLAIITAIVSSYKNIPVKPNSMIIGEVGLTGELRPVSQCKKRINEAKNLGISTIILPGCCRKQLEEDMKQNLSINNTSNNGSFIFVDTLSEAMDVIF